MRNERRLRSTAATMFLLALATALGACDFGSCPRELHETVTLAQAKADEASSAGDAGDAGSSLAGVTTVTQANCEQVCRAATSISHQTFLSCTPADDAGEPAADCDVSALCD